MWQKAGDELVAAVPPIIKSISVIGTVAMLAIGGSIVAHQTGALHGIAHFIEHNISGVGFLIVFIIEILFGLLIGYVTVQAMPILVWIRRKIKQELK